MNIQQLRIARPVADLPRSSRLECHGLALSPIGAFEQHQGFSGVMLGRVDLNWHLEFTRCDAHPLTPQVSDDDLLVLYIPAREQWLTHCQRMDQAGFQRRPAFNPYWDRQGVTFLDADGYRVVLQHAAWQP